MHCRIFNSPILHHLTTIINFYFPFNFQNPDNKEYVLRDELKKTFKKYDLIVGPVSPVLPFKIGEKNTDPLAMYLADIYTINVNLVGNPAISIPSGVSSEGFQLEFN